MCFSYTYRLKFINILKGDNFMKSYALKWQHIISVRNSHISGKEIISISFKIKPLTYTQNAKPKLFHRIQCIRKAYSLQKFEHQCVLQTRIESKTLHPVSVLEGGLQLLPAQLEKFSNYNSKFVSLFVFFFQIPSHLTFHEPIKKFSIYSK